MKNISIIGIGKLGICFALNLEKAGYIVLGSDLNFDYMNQIEKKTLKSSDFKLLYIQTNKYLK